MGEPGGGVGFLGTLGALGGAVANAFKSFFAISAKELLKLIKFLRDTIREIGVQAWIGLQKLGRLLRRSLEALARLIGRNLKRFIVWADKKLRALERYLKDFFAPVLRFIKRLKDEIRRFYTTYIRPIIDTIEFIRAVNRILTTFHITVLQGLDSILAQVEQRLEQPFLWINQQLTKIMNVIDQVMTLDGFFQRLTLIRSMVRYVPDWLRVAVNARSKPVTEGDWARIHRAFGGYAQEEIHRAVEASLLGRDGLYTPFVDEFAIQWRKEIESA